MKRFVALVLSTFVLFAAGLSKNKIAYQLKPRVMSVYNIFDSAHLGNMSNQKPKITYSVYVKKSDIQSAIELMKKI